MAQFARPASDVTTQWATTPLWSKIDEASADDGDFITGTGDAKTFECALSSVTDPSSSTGHVVRIRARATGSGGPERLNTWGLYQGGTAIVTQNDAITRGSFNDYSITLSGAQADAITNYGDLRIRATTSQGGSETIDVSWAEFECPDASTAHTKDLGDTVTLSESAGKGVGAARADSSTLADSKGSGAAAPRADTVTLNDLLAALMASVLADAVTLADEATPVILLTQNEADGITMLEAPAAGVTLVAADTEALADAALLAVQLGLADADALADALEAAVGLEVADAIAPADAPALEPGVTLADLLTLADAIGAALGLAPADVVALLDEATPDLTPGGLSHLENDALALGDAFALALGAALGDAIAQVDVRGMGAATGQADSLAVDDLLASLGVAVAPADALALEDGLLSSAGPGGPVMLDTIVLADDLVLAVSRVRLQAGGYTRDVLLALHALALGRRVREG